MSQSIRWPSASPVVGLCRRDSCWRRWRRRAVLNPLSTNVGIDVFRACFTGARANRREAGRLPTRRRRSSASTPRTLGVGRRVRAARLVGSDGDSTDAGHTRPRAASPAWPIPSSSCRAPASPARRRRCRIPYSFGGTLNIYPPLAACATCFGAVQASLAVDGMTDQFYFLGASSQGTMTNPTFLAGGVSRGGILEGLVPVNTELYLRAGSDAGALPAETLVVVRHQADFRRNAVVHRVLARRRRLRLGPDADGDRRRAGAVDVAAAGRGACGDGAAANGRTRELAARARSRGGIIPRMRLRFTKMQGAGNDSSCSTRRARRSSSMPRIAPPSRSPLRRRRRRRSWSSSRAPRPASTPPSTSSTAPAATRLLKQARQRRALLRPLRPRARPQRQEETLVVETMNRRLEPARAGRCRVSVDMGAPDFEPRHVPFDTAWLAPCSVESGPPLGRSSRRRRSATVAVASMGNPHAVQVVDDVDAAPSRRKAPLLERATPASARGRQRRLHAGRRPRRHSPRVSSVAPARRWPRTGGVRRGRRRYPPRPARRQGRRRDVRAAA